MSFNECITVSILHIVVRRQQISLKHGFWINVRCHFIVAYIVNLWTAIMMLRFDVLWRKRKLSLKVICVFHTFRSRIFLEIHSSCAIILVSTVLLQIWSLVIIFIRIGLIVLRSTLLLLLHLSRICSLVTISLILLLLFVLFIEVVHDIIIVSITFFENALNHTLSIGVLHRLFCYVFTHLLGIILVSVTVWIVLITSAGTTAWSVLIGAYLVLFFKRNTMGTMWRLSECKRLRLSTLPTIRVFLLWFIMISQFFWILCWVFYNLLLFTLIWLKTSIGLLPCFFSGFFKSYLSYAFVLEIESFTLYQGLIDF